MMDGMQPKAVASRRQRLHATDDLLRDISGKRKQRMGTVFFKQRDCRRPSFHITIIKCQTNKTTHN